MTYYRVHTYMRNTTVAIFGAASAYIVRALEILDVDGVYFSSVFNILCCIFVSIYYDQIILLSFKKEKLKKKSSCVTCLKAAGQ